MVVFRRALEFNTWCNRKSGKSVFVDVHHLRLTLTWLAYQTCRFKQYFKTHYFKDDGNRLALRLCLLYYMNYNSTSVKLVNTA